MESLHNGAHTTITAETHRIAIQCPMCWGNRAIFEPSELGLVPVVCDGCAGRGVVTHEQSTSPM